MVKLIVIESDLGRGIKFPGGKTINNDVPISLAGREIFKLFTKKVKVFELVNGEKIRLTPDNYLDDHSAIGIAVIEEDVNPISDEELTSEEIIEEDEVESPVENTIPETTETDNTVSDIVEEGTVNTEDVAPISDIVDEGAVNTEDVAPADDTTTDNVEVKDETPTITEDEKKEDDATPKTEVKVVPVPKQQFKKKK